MLFRSWNNVLLSLRYVQNTAASYDTLNDYNLRVRVYKNGALIYNNVDPAGARGYTFPNGNTSIPYGTMCNGDNIKVVYSLA